MQIDGIEIGGLDDDSEKKLRNLAKKRDELQQIEIQLRADMIVRSAIVEMKNNLNSQIEEQSGLIAEPQVQRGQELHDAMNFRSIQIDASSGLGDDFKKKLKSLAKKRYELQQMEIQLRADLMARSAFVEMKNNLDSQIKEPAALRAELQGQFDEGEQRIMKLHAIVSDYEATWATEDLFRAQNKEIPKFCKEHDNIEAERAMKQNRCIQEHIPNKDRQVSFPDAAAEHIFSFISSNADRNSISLVCKYWYKMERHSRCRVSISKCNNVSPINVIRLLPNVRSLRISGYITDSFSRSHALHWISMMVKGYPKMEEIEMYNSLMTDEGLDLIGGNFKNLRYLNLWRCSGFSIAGLSSIVTNCRSLRKLNLTDFDVDDAGLVEIFASCKELQELTIRLFKENNLTEQGIVFIAKGCPKLHTIEYNCSSMTNVALLTIADQLPNLSRLDIYLDRLSTDNLTDEPLDTGFIALLERCKNLKHLSIINLVITKRLLENIGTHGKKLETLKLSLEGLDGDLVWGLHNIVSGCSSLRSLTVNDGEFDDQALLAIGWLVEALESFEVFYCRVKYRTCKLLKQRYPGLIFEANGREMPLLDVADDYIVYVLQIKMRDASV